MINDDAVFDAISDLRDELQRVELMIAALCRLSGIDPAEIRRLPGEMPDVPLEPEILRHPERL